MNKQTPSKFTSIINNQLLPREELYKPKDKTKHYKIGIPNTVPNTEYRIPLTPQSIKILVENGHEVYIESGAGVAASFTDNDLSESGAVICDSCTEIYNSDIVLQMSPFTKKEISMLKSNQLLLSPLYITFQCKETMRLLMKRKTTAVGFEYMKDGHDMFPVTQIMSEITGYTAMVVGSEYSSTSHGGKGVMLGSVTGMSPTEIVIIGSGTAAEFAARSALAQGATVKAFDSSIYKLMNLQKRLGRRIFTSVFHPNALIKALRSADIIIGALSMNEVPKITISEDMVRVMKEKSVIIDLNIIQGGCFETSRLTNLNNPIYIKHNVIHYCVPNITARVARTASIALSNILAPILLDIGRSRNVNQYIKNNRGFSEGVYVFNGILTNYDVGEMLDLPVKDLDLLLAAF